MEGTQVRRTQGNGEVRRHRREERVGVLVDAVSFRAWEVLCVGPRVSDHKCSPLHSLRPHPMAIQMSNLCLCKAIETVPFLPFCFKPRKQSRLFHLHQRPPFHRGSTEYGTSVHSFWSSLSRVN